MGIPVRTGAPTARTATSPEAGSLLGEFEKVRHQTQVLCEPLLPEDFVIQSMPDASPIKWHLAHTTWFFETFLLAPNVRGYTPFRDEYSYLFNSYYNAVGERLPRPNRGLLSRPPIEEIFEYRAYVDDQMGEWLGELGSLSSDLAGTIALGLHHEQQHQELILTDLKHHFFSNPLRPVYRPREGGTISDAEPLRWRAFPAALRQVGYEGSGFAFDNELPRHPEYVGAFRLASRPVTNGEYLDFIDDGGYRRPELWLSDGWHARQTQDWHVPMYWERRGDAWWAMTLAGMNPVELAEPVCHVSFYEADAFARWADARLPTEAEWELAAHSHSVEGNFVESGRYHPAPTVAGDDDLSALFGNVWEWTGSPYSPYPGYRPASGALGEYNGKFMCNQMVLRGGSCASPKSHLRATYRNFFPPPARWQFSGIRLAKDV